MLPLHDAGGQPGSTTGLSLSFGGFKANLKVSHMDFEYALWLMVNLCTSPRTAFRSTLYHSRTKHQWARDDPAFLVLMLYLLLVACVAWSVAFMELTPAHVLGLFIYHAAVDLLLLGAALSTVGWFLANNYLHEQAGGQSQLHAPLSQHFGGWPSGGAPVGSHGAGRGAAPSRESVEWLYAFDVHCNAFVPLYVLLHVVQLLLLPLLLRPGFGPALLSNALYAVAFSTYHYLTFLGYSELPFLHRCECFVYPIVGVLLAFALSLPLGINATQWVASIYF
jgi:hypothetical protein